MFCLCVESSWICISLSDCLVVYRIMYFIVEHVIAELFALRTLIFDWNWILLLSIPFPDRQIKHQRTIQALIEFVVWILVWELWIFYHRPISNPSQHLFVPCHLVSLWFWKKTVGVVLPMLVVLLKTRLSIPIYSLTLFWVQIKPIKTESTAFIRPFFLLLIDNHGQFKVCKTVITSCDERFSKLFVILAL